MPTKLTNPSKTRSIGALGGVVGPQQSVVVKADLEKAKANAFVKSGMLVATEASDAEAKSLDSGKKVAPLGKKSEDKAPSAAEVIADIKAMEDEDELKRHAEDSRKTVADAAEARLDELQKAQQ